MKLYIKSILLFFIISFFCVTSVNAAYFDGGGSPAGSASGYKIGISYRTPALKLSPMMKINLVDISGDELNVKSFGFTSISDGSSYNTYFKESNAESPYYVNGQIEGNSYNWYGISAKDHMIPSDYTSHISRYVTSVGIDYVNFDVSMLREFVCGSGEICEVSENYKNIVLYLLEKNGIVASSEGIHQKFEELKSKIDFKKYRIIMEPIYVIKLSNGKFRFITTKALGLEGYDNSNGYNPYNGVYVQQLYDNAYSTWYHGKISPKGNCAAHSVEGVKNCYKDLSDPYNGAGYVIFGLDPSEENGCRVKHNDDNTFTLIDDKSVEYFSDSINYKYFIEKCGCVSANNADLRSSNEVLDNIYKEKCENSCKIEKNEEGIYNFVINQESTLDNNLVDPSTGSNYEYFIVNCGCNEERDKELLEEHSVLQSIYDRNCIFEEKKCAYELNTGGIYTFYDNDSNVVGNYSSFVRECGCNNEKVLEVSRANTILGKQYSDNCEPKEVESHTYDLKDCQVTNEFSLSKTKKVNNYCTRTCTEEVVFYDVMDTQNLEVMAGRYFKLDNNPKVDSTKTCEVKFEYGDWESDSVEVYNDFVFAYNNYKMYENATSFPDGTCGSEKDPKTYYSSSSTYECITGVNDFKFVTGTCYEELDGKCGSAKDFSSEISAFNNKLTIEKSNLSNFINNITQCQNAVNDFNKDDFYILKQEDNKLEFYYSQDIVKTNSIATIWNDNDKEMNSVVNIKEKLCNGVTNNAGKKCIFNNQLFVDNGEFQTESFEVGEDNLSVSWTYSVEFFPSKTKYVEPLTGKISIGSGKVKLGEVYNVDVAAREKSNGNYFLFTSLGEKIGEENELYKTIKEKVGKDAFKRNCTYKIKNDIIDCKEGECSKDLKLLYRVVEPSNIDPNNRIGNDNGMSNWKDQKAAIVMKEIEEDADKHNTYSPDNLEYSFTLDSATIKAIREYNDDKPYGKEENLTCNSAGNECISNFITEADKTEPQIGSGRIKTFANIISGRDKWKYLECSNNSDCEIVEKERVSDLNTDNGFVNGIRNLRSLFTDNKNKSLNP